MTAAASQWAWNFGATKATPLMVINLPNGGIFFFFAAINMISFGLALLLPETKGVSLEARDVIFGSVSQEQRDQEVAQRAAELQASEKERQFEQEKKEDQRFEQV